MPESGLPPSVRETVVTVGTFDGVHRGHQDVIARLVEAARQSRLPSLLLTFDPHPLEIVNPSAAPQLLTTGEEKLELLAETGLDYAAVVPFTHELAAYSAEEFVEIVLRRRFRMRRLLIGHDHGFGRARAGDATVLRQLGARDGFHVDVVGPIGGGDGHAFSSTAIRRAVAGGDLDRAAVALGRRYSVSGVVGRGEGRGRTIGFPTINLALDPRKLLPPAGVYAAYANTAAGRFGAMVNIGPRPTFGDTRTSVEAHLFDAAGDFYGSRVRLDIVSQLRDVVKFASAAELVAQLARDEKAARAALTHSSTSDNLPAPSSLVTSD